VLRTAEHRERVLHNGNFAWDCSSGGHSHHYNAWLTASRVFFDWHSGAGLGAPPAKCTVCRCCGAAYAESAVAATRRPAPNGGWYHGDDLAGKWSREHCVGNEYIAGDVGGTGGWDAASASNRRTIMPPGTGETVTDEPCGDDERGCHIRYAPRGFDVRFLQRGDEF